jgi:Mu transposase, C-terminal domain
MGTLRRVTDAQVKLLRRLLQEGASLRRAALKTDMDGKSARKYRAGALPSEARRPHTWRTRVDPLADVWPELAALLQTEPSLMAKTLWDWLQQTHPSQYAASVRRTLERRVRQWKAQHGPAKEVFFAQEHPPGRLAASDFTWMNELGVTIQGVPFDHLVYHFVLTHSNWEHVTVCFSESFASLSSGWQNAVWALGAVPLRHRTDRMTLAVYHDGNAEQFTANYQALLAHYGVTPEATNPARSHENGDAESAHGHFKRAVDQALRLRGSRDFDSRAAYEEWLSQLVRARNAGRSAKTATELACMRELPAARLETLERLRVRVSRLSTIRVKHNTYSVPARLIGEEVETRIGMEQIEVWYAQQLVVRLERLRGQDKHHIDYRHVIGWLVRKPGAFARYVYREDLYPTTTFRRAYDTLLAQQPGRADKEYVNLLYLASREGEEPVAQVLEELLRHGQPVSVLAVEACLGKPAPSARAALVEVAPVNLRQYDDLLEGGAAVADCPGSAGGPDDQDGGGPGAEPAAPGESNMPGSALERSWRAGCGEARGDIGMSVHSPNKEVNDESRGGGDAGEVPAGIMPVHDTGTARGGDAAGERGVVDVHALSAGAGAAGMPAAAPEAHRTLAEGLQAAVGEELANARSETLAAEDRAAVAGTVERRLPGPARECAAVRPTWVRQDACVVCRVPGVGAFGPADVVYQGRFVGPGAVGRQARPALAGGAQTSGPVGGVADRRSGLCATKPGGDGSAIHAAGRALRARQHLGDQQSAVLEMGTDLQGSDDGSGSDRPSGAPQCDRGNERAQLPDGESAQGQTTQRISAIGAAWKRWLVRAEGSGRSGGGSPAFGGER